MLRNSKGFNLEQLSKADLLWIFERICQSESIKRDVQHFLLELQQKKAEDQLSAADKHYRHAHDLYREYLLLIAPYHGKPLGEFPMAVLLQADAVLMKAQAEEAEADRIVKEVEKAWA